MKWTLAGMAFGSAMLAMAGTAAADGELNIYNWGNYTSPDLIKKFEETFKVKVTVTDYDSNDAALAKVRAGGHGFDIVVPSANYMPIWISEGSCSRAGLTRWRISRTSPGTVGQRRLGSRPALFRAMAVGHRPA